MLHRDWDLGDRYLSNHGAGPLEARILSWVDGVVTMERKPLRGVRWVRFTLPEKVALAPSCGWALDGQRAGEE